MERSRTPLTKWFLAIKLVSDPERGISALFLSRIIAVTYKTAWTMLHKIRFVMGNAEEANKLSGTVIINDACYGRPYNPTIYQHPQETPVLIGVSMNDAEPKRLVIRMVPPRHLSYQQVLSSGTAAFIEQYVAPSAFVLECQVKRYTPRKHKKALPLFRLAHKWINATFHGLGKKHLQAYLNEFCCRTNMRLTAAPIFEGMSRLCANGGAITYSALVRTAFNYTLTSVRFPTKPAVSAPARTASYSAFA